jgi:hypothetical protein
MAERRKGYSGLRKFKNQCYAKEDGLKNGPNNSNGMFTNDAGT